MSHLTSIEGDPLPAVMYHETRGEYVNEILTHGLEPRDTDRHHYPGVHENAGVEAVYLTCAPADHWWGAVRLEVEVDGLQLERDPALNPDGTRDEESPVCWAYRTRQPIPPSRIRVVASRGPWQSMDAAWAPPPGREVEIPF